MKYSKYKAIKVKNTQALKKEKNCTNIYNKKFNCLILKERAQK